MTAGVEGGRAEGSAAGAERGRPEESSAAATTPEEGAAGS